MKYSEYMKKKKEEEEQQSKGQSSKTSVYDSMNYSQYKAAQKFGLDTLESDLSSLGTTIESAYNGWQTKETMKNTKSSIQSMYNRLTSYQEYRKMNGITDDEEDVNELVDSYKSILDGWDDFSMEYGQYKSADSYNKAIKDSETAKATKEKQKTEDLIPLQTELDELKVGLDVVEQKIKSRKNDISAAFDLKYEDTVKKQQAYDQELNDLLKLYGFESYEDFKETISEKEAYLNRAKFVQAGYKLTTNATTAENYEEWSQEGMTYSPEDFGDTTTSTAGKSVMVKNDKYRNAAIALEEYQTGTETDFAFNDVADEKSVEKYRLMTDDEFKTFAYWRKYDKENGTELAYDYIDSIEEDLNIREGQATAERYKDKSALSKILYGVPAGLDQFASGVENALNFTDDYIPTTSTQYASQGIRRQLYDTGFDLPEWLGGSSFGQVAYDAVNTGANMLPSMAAGAVSEVVLPGSGTYVTAGLMGLSATGNAYQQMLNQGYNKLQSRTYATLVGLSEATLSAALSGMIGGKATEKTIENIIKGIDKGFLRFAIRWGLEGASEIPEESLQSILEPLFQNVALGYEKNKLEDTDWSQVAYDGLLGGLSGLGFGFGHSAINTAVEQSTWRNTGKGIRENVRVSDTFEIGAMLPQEAEAYETYTRYVEKGINAENVTDVQLGRLYDEANADVLRVLGSKKTTDKQKTQAIKTLAKLVEAKTENTVAKNKAKLTVGENTQVTSTGASAQIEGIKLDGENTTLVTSEGEVSVDDITLSETDAELVSIAQSMPESTANIFLSTYNAETNGSVGEYAKSFNNVVEMAKDNNTEFTMLENRGTLSTSQVQDIYNATVKAEFEARENAKTELTEKHSQKTFLKGKFDDSIIDRTSKTTDGSKVNWNSLTPTQRSAINFAQLFSKATGVNIKFKKSEVVNGIHKGENGSYKSATNTIEIDVYAGRIDAKIVTDSIIPTLSHELTHWMKDKSPAIYNSIREDVIKTLSENGKYSSDELIAAEMKRMKEAHSDIEVTPEDAIDELVARACEDMLSNSNEARKLLNRMSQSEQQSFIEKVKETFENLIQWVNDLLAHYKSNSAEAKTLQEYKDMLKKISKQWDAMLVDAIKTNQALQHEGIKAEDIISKDVAAHKIQFNERLVEKHIDMLNNNYSEESTLPLDKLLARYNKIVEMWRKLGGELNSQFLEDWNNKVGTDRTFSVFKAQAGYKYNVELSSMCKKGIPLFEAIDKIVKDEAMKELHTKNLGKAEKEILYDILKENNFDIPCAICYVEQARQNEGKIIDAFLDGFVEKSPTGKTLQYKLGWNETLDNIQKEMQDAGFNYTFPSLDRSVATDNYSPADLTMDEETQEHFFEALKKVANKEIRRYNKEQNKGKPKKLITKTDAKSINEVFKGKLPLNLMMFRTMFNDPSSRFKIDNDLLYSSMTTQNLAKNHNALYSVFNAQGGVGGYKTKQGTIVYWADILKKTWKPSKLRDEGGVRNQSNSDFLMYTLLDHTQMYIDFTAKGYYLQAYTKVLSELKLFGLSKGKINASFIPKVHVYRNADGSIDVEKTQLNAGLDENGNPIFDDVEGIPHDEAFMLVEDGEYSKSIGGVCIGYSDNHISKLLDDNRIQLIIGFHDKTNDTSKRYKGAVYAKNYNGINEATKYDKDGKLKTVHLGFNQFVRKAENKFKNKDSIEYNGKTYKYNDIPKLAADLYIEHCENKGMFPAYSQGGTDFSKHPNYYKLLADFSLYDINGNYSPHQKVEYNMPDQVPYLDENGKKSYMSTEDYIKKELKGELAVRDAISEKLADKSENGIIPQFIERANALYESKDTKFSDRDSAGNVLSEGQQEFFKDSKVRDANGNLKVMWHGTHNKFTVFDISKAGKNWGGDSRLGKGFYFANTKEEAIEWAKSTNVIKAYLNLVNPLDLTTPTPKNIAEEIDKYVEKLYAKYDENTYFITREQYRENLKRIKEMYLNDASLFIDTFKYDDNGNMTDGIREFLTGLGYDGIVSKDETVAFYPEQIKETTNKKPTSNPDMRFSDRDNVSVYDKMGETEKLIKENEQLKEDVEMLKERLKLEGKVTHGEYFNQNQLNAVATHIRSLANSSFDKKTLASLIDGIYKYIAHSPDLNWQDMYAQCYDVARMVLDEAKPVKIKNDYNEYVLKQISGATLYANETQIKEAEYKYGKHWRNKLKGRFKITDNPSDTSIDTMWTGWSSAKDGYPNIFDASETASSKLASLIDAVESLREATEIVEEYDVEEQTRSLAYEIYNKFWTVQPIRTTADKYTKEIKRLNFKHRQAMDKLRADRDAKLQAQHKFDKQKANELYKNLRERKDKEIAEIKKLGKERLDAYKENAERKTKIQSITSNAIMLNKQLTTNSNDVHIHETMKPIVIELLNAIDFSSRRMLDKNIPTEKDKSLARALSKVKDMLNDANDVKNNGDFIDLFGYAMTDEMVQMFNSVEIIRDEIGNNEYILQNMSLQDLATLDKLVKVIKHTISKVNQFHTIQSKQGIYGVANETIAYLDSLGKGKEYGKFGEALNKTFAWNNITPYYAFKKFGDAGMKVFESMMRGWDKFAFNTRLVENYANDTYTTKEVQDWEKEIKTFEILQPDGEVRKVKMPVSFVMALHCVSKQEDAIRHLTHRGMTLATVNDNGKVITDYENTILSFDDINNITSTLTERQKEVADKLQKFLNEECTDWANEISLKRFGIKMFDIPNYFPIKVSPSTVLSEDVKDSGASLYALLNMNWTKPRSEKADQSIEIGSIFDVWAKHTSEIAKYNALALPILDMNRWYAYKGKTETGKEFGVNTSLKVAFGTESTNYIRTFLQDLNGQKNVARDNLSNDFFRNAKVAAVANNIRVVALQFTSYARASAVIDSKYLTNAFMHKPKFERAEQHSGMAQWKSQGYYDVNITRGLTEKIKHADSKREKFIEWSLKGAEWADKITFGYLWNACELEIRDTRKDLKVGSNEFYETVGNRLTEIIYATQVVDSTMTRSQMMRSSDNRDKMLTAFMSEPTLSYNMLANAATQANLEKRVDGKISKGTKKYIARTIVAYTITNAMAALIESGFDAWRDDDDEEMDMAKFMEYYLTNFASDMSIVGKIPYLKEFVSLLQGYSSPRNDTQWMNNLIYAGKSWAKAFQGEGSGDKAIKYSIKFLSDISGLAFYNLYRDLMAGLDKFDLFTAEELEELINDIFG